MQVKTILIPVDFSQISSNAVDYAMGLAKQLNFDLIFVHSYSLAYPASMTTGMAAMSEALAGNPVSQEETIEKRLKDFLDAFPELNNFNHKSFAVFGATVDIICQVAKDKMVDLIVMGTAGASDMEGFFMGTVSEKVSREAHCPVLVVPESRMGYSKVKTLGFALDTDSLESLVDLSILEVLVKTNNAKLNLIHITEQNETVLSEKRVLDHYQKAFGENLTFQVFKAGDPEEGVDEFLNDNPIDILVLLFRKHGFFERLFNAGLRRKLLFDANIPLLIIK